MDFGDTLRSVIEDSNKTQKEVARGLNIAPTTLGNYVNKLREPDFDTLLAIANYFGVSTDYLLNNYKDSDKNQSEERLLNIYSKLSAENKELLLNIAKLLNK